MKYNSTRGGEKGRSFEDVLFAGYASDNGLYMPDSVPKIDAGELESNWSNLSYLDLVKKVCSVFVPEEELPAATVSDLVEEAFSTGFSAPEGVRCTKVGPGLLLGEMFHGPTMTFKDLALSVAGRMMEHMLARKNKHYTVVVGTSGDTGSAAIHAVRPLKSVDIVVLLPRGRITQIQERQMTTVVASNVHVYSVEGTSDDLDEPIREVFSDSDFVSRHGLCSLNSVNWARVMVQAAHYLYFYFRASKEGCKRVRVVVPTGACGNVTGGFVAHRLLTNLLDRDDWPDLNLVTAVNENDVVHRLVAGGVFAAGSGEMAESWASAIDIQAPYNVERLVYLASGMDAAVTKSLMEEMEKDGKVQIPEDIMDNIRRVIGGSGAFTNSQIESSIRRCHYEFGLRICPHTAVAFQYHADNPASRDTTTVAVATASPAKFPEALRASGVEPETSPEVEALMAGETRSSPMDKGMDWTAMLREKVEEITRRWEHGGEQRE